ncbi:MAG TPA: mannitol dehydrogenase family protein [Flexivirga sp.]|uniref:mannitol dehydrogenase family protein n=1 Tax=Flexivirga sp. TaxID=1962927 RepID=UPI002BFEC20C|nr:mannitol dehydrogenase family protein [Flexivirga sp.]HWC24204.1 mannitol dehydrogenase family protein [Flexivirga sp.]
MERLTLSTLGAIAGDAVTGPRLDPRSLSIGLVHLGIGAFHRAHQAVYTELAAAATGDDRWGEFAVTGRSATVVQQLQPQDGLYGVLTKSSERSTLHVVGGVRTIVNGGGDTAATLAAIADPAVRVVTLTITEKGYRTGSSLGVLATGLAARFRAGAEPISVVSCDNLSGNGEQLRRLVQEHADAAGPADFVTWLRQCVAFPSTMVDRIVPATTDRDRAEAEALLGLRDEGLVVAEPFGQWVIEDNFAADRPAWERAGATLAADVAPYEKAKLRMLNGTHSLLAYLGALHGYSTIAEAVADEQLYDAARALQREDAIPTLEAPPGTDLAAYGDQILERFGNPHLRHTTIQVAMDGSQKLPIRLLDTARDRLRAGAVPHHCALAVAAWIVYVHRGQDRLGRELPLNDPLAPVLREHAAGSEEGLVDRMFGLREVFDEEIAGQDAFREAVRDATTSLLKLH